MKNLTFKMKYSISFHVILKINNYVYQQQRSKEIEDTKKVNMSKKKVKQSNGMHSLRSHSYDI